MTKELKPEELRRTINPKELGGEIVAGEIIGQERVKKTLELLGIQDKHYNIFVAGSAGTGKTKQVLAELEKIVPTKPTPPDICYVQNFKNPDQPRFLDFPAGAAKQFARELPEVVQNIIMKIQMANQSPEFQRVFNQIFLQIKGELKNEIEKSKEYKNCKDRDVDIIFKDPRENNPLGIAISFIAGNETLEIDMMEFIEDYNSLLAAKSVLTTAEEQYKEISDRLKEKYKGRLEEINSAVKDIIIYFAMPAARKMQQLCQLAVNEYRKQQTKPALYQFGKKYRMPHINKHHDTILSHLEELGDELLKHLDAYTIDMNDFAQLNAELQNTIQTLNKQLVAVNLLVDNLKTKGAPIVVETDPTLQNLFGYIEILETKDGYIRPTFQNIRAGSVHRAMGGYLIIDAGNIFDEELWHTILKTLERMLKNEHSVISNVSERLGFRQLSLKPDPIPLNAPLNVKIILVGPKRLYSILNQIDDKFNSLFHKAEVEQESNLTPKLQKQIASHLRKYAIAKTLKPLAPDGLARVLEYGLEMAESQEKIDMRLGELEKLILEANNRTDRTYQINAKDVEKALEEREFRNNLIEERYFELIEKKRLQIDVSGKKIGEGNGLVVMCHDNHTFAYAEKVTCNVFAGKGKITFIDKKAKYTGKMFNKAAAIITSWLKERYAKKKALRLSAEICFEQSYYDTDGPSASIIKAAVLVSAISEIPMRQDCAATGTMNQKGVIGPIGGVNYKSRGFYKTCLKRGKLIGTQGVIIPKVNADDNLMLHEKIVESVKKGKFHIYPVKKIEEALEILLDTDMKTIDKAMNRALNRKK